MSEISFPDSWAESSLSSLISIQGLISDGDWVESKDQDPSGLVRLIQLADIGDGDFRDKSDRYMTHDKANALNCTYLKQGDVLIARMPDPLGRACIFPGVNQDAVTVVDVCLIRTGNNSAMSNQLLKYWINSPVIRSRIELNASGTTRKRITRKKLEEFNFPVPPLAEQKVIVDKLDTLLAQVESIKARLERIPEILKQFRQSVLAAAVSGKLTEEWREKASNLKQVVIEGKYTIDENYSYLIPNGWCLTSIANTSSFQQGLQIAKNTRRNELEDGVLPILRTVNYENDFSEDVHYALVDNKSIIAEADDIILSRTGTVGRVLTGYRGIMHNNSFRLNYNNQLLKRDYLIYFLNSPGCQQFIVENSGRSSQPDLTHKAFSKCPISIPSLEEQEEIIRRIGIFFTSSAVIEKQVQLALDRVNNLTQSILAKAFRGELTAEWREAHPELISDENSAEALLERIKAERSARPVTKRGKGKA